MKNEKIKYFSMFSGVGGFELGFQKSGSRFKCVGFSEIEKFASQVLRYRFPGVRNYGDITKIKLGNLPNFDVLCGGFPCQAFSIAGKRKGFKDTRGTLFFEVARILKAKRPAIVFLENVKGLLSHEKGQTFKVILQTLYKLGYDVQWLVCNSRFFSVPQNRERVFIIANLRETPRPQILPFKESGKKDFKLQAQTNTIKTSGSTDYIAQCKQLPQTKGNPQGKRVYQTSGVSQTLTASGSGVGTGLYLDNLKIRRLTPKECERLQGFPDNWTKFGTDEDGNKVKISDTQRYKQMGNAVTTNVIKAIAEKLFVK